MADLIITRLIEQNLEEFRNCWADVVMQYQNDQQMTIPLCRPIAIARLLYSKLTTEPLLLTLLINRSKYHNNVVRKFFPTSSDL